MEQTLDFSDVTLKVTLSPLDNENFFLPPGFSAVSSELLKAVFKGKFFIMRITASDCDRFVGCKVFEASQETEAEKFFREAEKEHFKSLKRGCVEFYGPHGYCLESHFA